MDFLSILLDAPVLIPTLGAFVVALIVGRWWVLLPAVGWPMYFLGLAVGWWGGPPGDFWYYALAVEALVGMAAAAAGVLLHRLGARAGGRVKSESR
jgi:hypothetical protein